jgi:hypothetical protein
MQHNLYDISNYFIERAYKTDLTLYELETDQHEKLYSWKGRLLMTNILAYHKFHGERNYVEAMKYISESQQIASK